MAWGPQQTSRVTSSQNVILVVAERQWPFYAPLYFHGVDVRDVARAHVHLLEDKRAIGRYIIALDQKDTAVSMYDVNLAIKEDSHLHRQLHFGIEWKLPVWVFSQMLWLNPLLDKSMLVAAKRGHGCGFDGTRLTKELQFEYHHTSIKQTIRDSAKSMVDFGLVGIKRPKWHWFAGLALFLMVVVFYCCCWVRSSSEYDKKTI
jgi:nucleoside-diphosphate-sugar epimerase